MTRVSAHLNGALHDLMAADPRVHLLGEDVRDPYGGAFKVTKGLYDRFGDRVRSTPISENAIVGVGAGLALAGRPAIVEIMFADFAALAFDQLVNFAAKSTAMYGRPVPIPLIVRCPSGGNRGYGPTHSQSPQKHFIGVPGLHVYELTPFHDAGELIAGMFATERPCLLFEDKVLYTSAMYTGGVVDDLFRYEIVGGVARVFHNDDPAPDCTLIVPGGMVHRALSAAWELMLEQEVICELLVPARLYPVPDLPGLNRVRHVCVLEDGTEGGAWGAEVARVLHPRLWSTLRRPITLAGAAASVIPAAPHLEREVLLQPGRIKNVIMEAIS
ncbi:pyruvate dehydrogenase E1 component beta subunit [Thermocatellispora tengchongensis]|uniref:Pyruvate dehydrogenase E1 component beta subunit n=1 Tax=Thermocatellispora tengchongensis TaxID=1073253 RepID=A0A840PAR9_9ACTN|nr:transketolase C-terminal domain-containing protein [Thermocatellispora tengchongensis]MBB5136738.1 pyruvate dehydrogenase E1 component beta subunit [Thermocatellispora tengchongensis]